tara:strand:- start:591 stop:1100 length:510 start_codon:yes stop_codon:yes gene_type:complete
VGAAEAMPKLLIDMRPLGREFVREAYLHELVRLGEAYLIGRCLVAAHIETAVQQSLFEAKNIQCVKYNNSSRLEGILRFEGLHIGRLDQDSSIIIFSDGSDDSFSFNINFGKDYLIIASSNTKEIHEIFEKVTSICMKVHKRDRPRGRLCSFLPTFSGKIMNYILAQKG